MPPWNEQWQESWVADRLKWVEAVPGFCGYVAVKNGQVIGGILGYGMPFKGRIDFEVLELFVHPSQQSAGVGQMLVQTLEQKLKAEHSRAVFLLTASQSSAEKFYQALGYNTSETMCFMSKRLE